MKKFEIVKTTAEISWKERNEIKEGCTMYDVDPEVSSRSKSFRSRKTNMTKTASGSEAEIFESLLQWKFSWSTKKRGKRSQKSKLTKRRRRPQKSMRAMQAPISRFANKKKSRVKMARLFYLQKMHIIRKIY